MQPPACLDGTIKRQTGIFTALTDELAVSINAHSKNTNQEAKAITKAIIKSAKKAIPRGVRKNYRPYWTEELEEFENEVNVARKEVEEHPSVVNNVNLKRKTAKLHKATIRTQRQGWQEKTASLNMEKDGNKLWRLIESLSGSEGKATQIALEKDGNLVTVKATANLLIKQYAAVSNIEVDPERKIQTRKNTH
ncbi:hypothetical protein ElyMa_001410500 [Elysia marginata]|uniref:Uncharacterized protein n=1 Tax=Elysia marginata TaxID=1093978 RepID=A0AAV4IWZ1_9GAST|nr:hypothetical protein ElyMa_001410500 [Elysia marginata]